MQVAFASQSLGNSDFCGDQMGFWVRGSVATLCVVDGLGHGPEAEQAAKQIVGYVGLNLDLPLEILLAGANEAARDTRGAALGLVFVNRKEGSLTHVGIGNTRGILLDTGSGSVKSLQSTNGIVGAGYQKLRPETMDFKTRDLLFLYTDGFPVSVDVISQDIGEDDPEEVANEFMQRYSLNTDDAAVLVARLEIQR